MLATVDLEVGHKKAATRLQGHARDGGLTIEGARGRLAGQMVRAA